MNEPLDALKRTAYLLRLKCAPDASKQEIEKNYLDMCLKLRTIAEKNPRLKPVADKQIDQLTEAYNALLAAPPGCEPVWFDTPGPPSAEELEQECAAAAAPDNLGEPADTAQQSETRHQASEQGSVDPAPPDIQSELDGLRKEVAASKFFWALKGPELDEAREAAEKATRARRQAEAARDEARKTRRDLEIVCNCLMLVMAVVVWMCANQVDTVNAKYRKLADQYEELEKQRTQSSLPATSSSVSTPDRPGVPLAPLTSGANVNPNRLSMRATRKDGLELVVDTEESQAHKRSNRLRQELQQGRALARYQDWRLAYDAWRLEHPQATAAQETAFMREWYEQWDREHPEPETPQPDLS